METDFDISYWDRKDIPNRIHDLLESLIFRIGKAEADEYKGGDHAPPRRRARGRACPHVRLPVRDHREAWGRLIRRNESNRLRIWATEFDDAYGSQIEDFFSRGDTVSYAATAYMVRRRAKTGVMIPTGL